MTGQNSSHTDTSKVIGVFCSTRSAAEIGWSASIHARRFTTARWLTVTPFGRPVEPDVNNVYAASSAASGRSRTVSVIGATEPSTGVEASTTSARVSPAGTASRSATSTIAAPAVVSMYSMRSSGRSESTGTYCPPAATTAWTATIISIDRGTATATAVSGPTPAAISSRARVFTRAPNSVNDTLRPSNTSAGASPCVTTASAT
ncbi:hypothetical protein GCM10023197_41270 [Gordonia humi]